MTLGIKDGSSEGMELIDGPLDGALVEIVGVAVNEGRVDGLSLG